MKLGPELHADEVSQWDGLQAIFETHGINHPEATASTGPVPAKPKLLLPAAPHDFRPAHHEPVRCLAQYAHEAAQQLRSGTSCAQLAVAHPISRNSKGIGRGEE